MWEQVMSFQTYVWTVGFAENLGTIDKCACFDSSVLHL